ncbi:MAG: DUF3380 domain-containing protein [Erythrobacter sp.]|nr:DUF3380 domain-containing protein [Erythrobacter sp.]
MPVQDIDSFFSPNPARLGQSDYLRAAEAIDCEVAAIRAVIEVESLGSGIQRDGRPRILFERHCFHRDTEGRWSGLHPDISSPRPGGYRGRQAEYDRLAKAMLLDRGAALRSASWGAFQIMGFNHRVIGFDTVSDFVAAMIASEANQLDAFIGFIRANRLDAALRAHDWATFARGYNGRNYRTNRYDEKLAAAFARHAGEGTLVSLLRRGARGRAVRRLQELLEITVGGHFGPATEAAVRAFQRARRLSADGIVGPQTWASLAS